MKKMLLTGIALGLGLAFASAANAQIKIGVAGPITGPNAAFGAQLKNGAEQAVEDINAAGGVMGQKLALVGRRRRVRSEAGRLGREQVRRRRRQVGRRPLQLRRLDPGIGCLPGVRHHPDHAGVDEPALHRASDMWNVFRTCGRDDQQGEVAGTYLAKNFKGKKVAVVHDKTPYGKGLADETQKTMNKQGLKEVMYEGVNTGEKDYSALVSKLKQANVDVVYFGGLHTEAGLIIRQMRDQGLNAPMMSGDGIVSSEFVSIAGPGAEGTLMTFSPDPRKNPNAKAAVEKFRKKNFEPEAYTLYSYAAVQVYKQAAEAVKSTDPKKMAEYMRSGKTFKTVIGDISFDKKGDITRPDYVMYVWKKGADGKIDYSGNEMGM